MPQHRETLVRGERALTRRAAEERFEFSLLDHLAEQMVSVFKRSVGFLKVFVGSRPYCPRFL
jgi:hypothetical protein